MSEVTDEQLLRVLRDSVSQEPDPEYGHSYHQTKTIEIEIKDGVGHIGDSFYGFPFDLAKLRANLSKIGLL